MWSGLATAALCHDAPQNSSDRGCGLQPAWPCYVDQRHPAGIPAKRRCKALTLSELPSSNRLLWLHITHVSIDWCRTSSYANPKHPFALPQILSACSAGTSNGWKCCQKAHMSISEASGGVYTSDDDFVLTLMTANFQSFVSVSSTKESA